MKKNYKVEKNEYGFYQVTPSPSEEEILKFYSNEFYTDEYKNFNDSSLEVQLKDKEFFHGKWNDIYENFVEINKKFKNKADILDVGCGWCQALLFFKAKGYNCFGFDPAIEAVEYGCKKGLKIKHAGLKTVDVFEGRKFDIISLFNVFEHLSDPVIKLKQIKSILNEDGILVIDVPNDFNQFQLAGKEMHQLKEWWVQSPIHLNYFSNDSLINLLNKMGFEVKISESSFPLEMFLLFGDNYIKDPKLGDSCHKRRVAFEQNLRSQGKSHTLKKFYRSLASLNLGRQVAVYAKLKS